MVDIDYESEVAHEYAIGNLENIKIGNLVGDDVYKTFDLEHAKTIYSQSSGNQELLITSPKIMGVYRRFKLTFNPNSEQGEPLERRLDLEPKEGFDIHSSLVQIGFDPNLFQVGVINQYIGSEVNRMIVIPYQNLKAVGTDLKKFSDLSSKRLEEIIVGKNITSKEIKEYLFLIKELLKSEGLTQPDYDLLRSQLNGILR